jgi:hypothetical protein
MALPRRPRQEHRPTQEWCGKVDCVCEKPVLRQNPVRPQSRLVITLLLHLLRLLPFLVGGHRELALENLALRQQLVIYKRTVPRPKLHTTDRLFWAGLARLWTGWRQALVIQVWTLRERLVKVAVWVERSVRRIVLHLPQAFPWRAPWRALAQALTAT